MAGTFYDNFDSGDSREGFGEGRGGGRGYSRGGGGYVDRGSWGGGRSGGRGALPTEPPYEAYVGNLPYHIDEEDVRNFFSGLKVKSVNLVEDRDPDSGRLRSLGFGFVEFEDAESLKKALEFDGASFGDRNLKVNVARSRPDGNNGRGGGYGGGRDRGSYGSRGGRGSRGGGY